ncbi:MAG: response regulator [Thermodesulfobacteriota bacterium]|nr:response regulator [Thermodesulfobacteriota bacterium]
MNEEITILVVDDEKVVRNGCLRVLTGKGYEDVMTAENGKEAMEILSEKKVDIVLLDLKMPIMSGEEVLQKIQLQYPDVPVIIITGHGTIDTAVECMKQGAYDFITKPFQIDQFILTINRAAEKRRLEQKARRFQEENVKNLYDLNLEKSRLKTIINCMANGVMVTNRNLEVVLHNPALMRLLEIADNVENPISVTQMINNHVMITTLQRMQSGEYSGKAFISQEFTAKKNALRAISAPALGPHEEIVGTVTVLEDVTAFKQLDEMKSDFVNMVAHELRSPLVAIRQQNSVLMDGLAGDLQPKQAEFINRGSKKIDQLLELINDLLDIAKIEAGIPIQHQVPTDLENIIKETISLMESRGREQNVTIKYVCRNMKPVQADPKRMEEVFSNLITNAINYSPGGGSVDVLAQGLGEYVEIKVKDTGVGIDSEELPKIFDRFYRVKHQKTRQVMGTGLGLSIVKGILEAHHGTIDVESTPNKGTTFRILLPVVASNE